MTAPLDEKALADAHDAFYATESSNSRDMMRNAIRAYLAASPSPSMEMDELSERLLSAATDIERAFLHRIDHSGEDWRLVNPDGETAAAIMREAQSSLAAMRAERDEAVRRGEDQWAGWVKDYHGHMTMADGSHVPLTKEEAEALLAAVEAEKAKRANDMPTALDALRALISAEERLRDLGWSRGGGLRVRRGDECAVAEQGSTGMWKGWFDDDGKYVHFGDCVSDPRKTFLKPLADLMDDERAHMIECDRREAEAYSTMIEGFAALSQGGGE